MMTITTVNLEHYKSLGSLKLGGEMQLYPKRDSCFDPWLATQEVYQPSARRQALHLSSATSIGIGSTAIIWKIVSFPPMGVWMLPQLLNIINNSSTAWTWATLATMTPLKTLWAPWNLICNVPPKTDKPDHHLFSRTLAGNELAWHQLSATRDWKLQVFSPTPPWKCLVASQLNQDGFFKACYFAAPLGGAKVHVLYLLHPFSQVASFPRWLCWSGTPYEAAGLAIAPVEWSRHPSLRLECGLWDTALKIAGQTWPSYKVEGMLCCMLAANLIWYAIGLHKWYHMIWPSYTSAILMVDCNWSNAVIYCRHYYEQVSSL